MQPLFLRALKAQLVLLITSLMFFTTGCEDDDHDHDEDHTDAEGFVLENESGTEVYKEFEGAIVTNNLTLSVEILLSFQSIFLNMMAMKLNTMRKKVKKMNYRYLGLMLMLPSFQLKNMKKLGVIIMKWHLKLLESVQVQLNLSWS